MSTQVPTSSATPQAVASTKAVPSYAAAVLAMSIGSFGIGTGEFAIMGLLPEVAHDLAISIPQAGHVISAYALGVVLGAPLLAVLCARMPRRALLVALMLVFALGNVASALAPSYASLAVLRFLTAFPHGPYFGVAALVAVGMAPPGQRTLAVVWVMMGLSVATVVGVPIASVLGEWLGWRWAFGLVGAIGLLAAALVWRHVPHVEPDRQANPWRELGALRRGQVWLSLGMGAVGFGGLFAFFSYVKPILLEVTHMPLAWVAPMLSLLGVGMVVGSLVGARLADKHLMRALGGIMAWSLLVLLAVPWLVASTPGAMLAVFLVGTIGAMGAPLQVRLMDYAGDAQTLAAAMHHSAFNLANALGAWLGGLVIAWGWGWLATAWVGAAMALGGLLIFAWAWALERRAPPARPAH